jgi:hypothetical protein
VTRFPVYTDADIHGPIVDGLIDRGWSVVRAVDARPEGTDDLHHFELAASFGRVLIANDKQMKAIAERWIEEGRSFPGLIWWPRTAYTVMSKYRHPRGHRRWRPGPMPSHTPSCSSSAIPSHEHGRSHETSAQTQRLLRG